MKPTNNMQKLSKQALSDLNKVVIIFTKNIVIWSDLLQDTIDIHYRNRIHSVSYAYIHDKILTKISLKDLTLKKQI